MHVLVGETAQKAAARGAEKIAVIAREAVEARRRFVVALSGGEGLTLLYDALRARKDIEWNRWEVFYTDECAVSQEDPRSHHQQADASLLSRLPIRSERIHPMFSLGMDLDQAAADYATELVTALGEPPVFDLAVLSLARDGTVASLAARSPAFGAEARVVALYDPDLEPAVDRVALSSSMLTSARSVVVVANGRGYGRALQTVLDEPDDRGRYPGQVVRDVQGDVTFVLDREAAATVGR